jgi:hypothetical protein
MGIFTALMLLIQPGTAPADFSTGRTATIFATIDRSEWCPAGNVQIDLVTGGFALTSGASRDLCNDTGLQRPVTKGQLDEARLATLRTAYTAAQRQGLTQCGGGKKPGRIVVSNGGPAILVLTNGAGTIAAPDQLGCWTDAAMDLSRLLERILGSGARRLAPKAP